MKYNFDKLAKRKNTNSLKWDNSNCFLPMWVADMDFKVFPLVKETLKQRVNIEAYGYSIIDEGFYESVANFFLRNHQLKLNKENIIFTTGVVPAISSMVRRLTKAGEKVYHDCTPRNDKMLAILLKFISENELLNFTKTLLKIRNIIISLDSF